jgi:hypothetical protein
MCVLRYIYINNSGIYNNTNADNIKKSINKDYYYYYNKSNNNSNYTDNFRNNNITHNNDNNRTGL